jgi:hypothetical protein
MDAAISTFDCPCLGRHSRAITGRHTGREQNGSSTIRPTTTKHVPRPTGLGPLAAPSCCQAAANTFFPDRLNSVSSTATVSAKPSGSRDRTSRWDSARPNTSTFQDAREKKACARSWDQARDSPAAVSIPVTVRFPVAATSPVTSAANVRRLGAVNVPNLSSNAISDGGTVGSGSIGGPLPEVVTTPPMLLSCSGQVSPLHSKPPNTANSCDWGD